MFRWGLLLSVVIYALAPTVAGAQSVSSTVGRIGNVTVTNAGQHGQGPVGDRHACGCGKQSAMRRPRRLRFRRDVVERTGIDVRGVGCEGAT